MRQKRMRRRGTEAPVTPKRGLAAEWVMLVTVLSAQGRRPVQRRLFLAIPASPARTAKRRVNTASWVTPTKTRNRRALEAPKEANAAEEKPGEAAPSDRGQPGGAAPNPAAARSVWGSAPRPWREEPPERRAPGGRLEKPPPAGRRPEREDPPRRAPLRCRTRPLRLVGAPRGRGMVNLPWRARPGWTRCSRFAAKGRQRWRLLLR